MIPGSLVVFLACCRDQVMLLADRKCVLVQWSKTLIFLYRFDVPVHVMSTVSLSPKLKCEPF